MTNPPGLPEINVDFLLGKAEWKSENRERRHGTRFFPFHGLKVNRNTCTVSGMLFFPFFPFFFKL